MLTLLAQTSYQSSSFNQSFWPTFYALLPFLLLVIAITWFLFPILMMMGINRLHSEAAKQTELLRKIASRITPAEPKL